MKNKLTFWRFPAGFLAWAFCASSILLGQPLEKSRVFYAIDNSAVGPAGSINSRTVHRMVNSLVCGVTGRSTPSEAWKTLVSRDDVVGIKVTASGRTVSGTNSDVVDAIAEGLIEAGIPKERIIVWDKNFDDLVAAGYKTDSQLYHLQGIDSRNGYDSRAQVSAPVIGKLIWGDSQFGSRAGMRLVDVLSSGEQLSSRSFYAKILSSQVTKVINVPSLTDSFLTGINGAIASMTLGNLDNWRRFAKSSAEGDTYLAEVYADATIRNKVVLTLLDGLVLQYAGGPFPNPNYAVENYSLFASKDPVAIDATALRLIEEVRRANKLPSIRTMASYIEAASQLGLGEFAEPRIEMVRVGGLR